MPLGSGVKKVTTAGTPEALAGSTRCESVQVTALTGNTKPVWVGGSATSHTAKEGTPLAAGATIEFSSKIDAVDDLAQVFVDPEVNGEGVSFSYGHRP